MRFQSKPIALLGLLLAAVGGAAFLLTGCGGGQGSIAGAKEEQLYTCGMHPQVIQNKPGNCPICGMKLTPVRKQGSAPGATASGQKDDRIKERSGGGKQRSLRHRDPRWRQRRLCVRAPRGRAWPAGCA